MLLAPDCTLKWIFPPSSFGLSSCLLLLRFPLVVFPPPASPHPLKERPKGMMMIRSLPLFSLLLRPNTRHRHPSSFFFHGTLSTRRRRKERAAGDCRRRPPPRASAEGLPLSFPSMTGSDEFLPFFSSFFSPQFFLPLFATTLAKKLSLPSLNYPLLPSQHSKKTREILAFFENEIPPLVHDNRNNSRTSVGRSVQRLETISTVVVVCFNRDPFPESLTTAPLAKRLTRKSHAGDSLEVVGEAFW